MTGVATATAPRGLAPRRPRPAAAELAEALRAATAAERRVAGHDHGAGELSYPKLRALAALARSPELTAGQLARSAGLTPATVTGLLDHLEDAGIVRRTRSTTDRRVLNVSLTDAGRELFESRYGAWQRYWEQRLASISDDDLETAARVLDAVAALYDDAAAGLGRAGPESQAYST